MTIDTSLIQERKWERESGVSEEQEEERKRRRKRRWWFLAFSFSWWFAIFVQLVSKSHFLIFFLFCRITYVPKLNYSSSYILSYPFISVSLGQDFSILDGYHLHLQVFSFIGFFFFLHTRTQPHGGSSNAEPC